MPAVFGEGPPSDLILIWLYLHRSYFQVRLHSEVLEVRTLTDELLQDTCQAVMDGKCGHQWAHALGPMDFSCHREGCGWTRLRVGLSKAWCLWQGTSKGSAGINSLFLTGIPAVSDMWRSHSLKSNGKGWMLTFSEFPQLAKLMMALSHPLTRPSNLVYPVSHSLFTPNSLTAPHPVHLTVSFCIL